MLFIFIYSESNPLNIWNVSLNLNQKKPTFNLNQFGIHYLSFSKSNSTVLARPMNGKLFDFFVFWCEQK